jgi:hypothetical protein
MFGILESSSVLTVSIPPKYQGSEMNGIVNYFDSLLLKYFLLLMQDMIPSSKVSL